MKQALTIVGAAVLLLVQTAAASTWCGENGTLRFDFAGGDSLVTVFDAGEPEQGVTRVKVHCWLDDLDPVALDGEAFLYVGGFELMLDVTGAEAFILGQEIPGKSLDLGKELGTIAAGLYPGLKIEDGRVLLATWDVMFQGRPRDVRFGLDPAGARSCATMDDCPVGETHAIYVGNEGSRQLTYMFGAAYEPAWLNPTGEVDQEPVRGPRSWREVGVFAGREAGAGR
jgi:hypothetical protein